MVWGQILRFFKSSDGSCGTQNEADQSWDPGLGSYWECRSVASVFFYLTRWNISDCLHTQTV